MHSLLRRLFLRGDRVGARPPDSEARAAPKARPADEVVPRPAPFVIDDAAIAAAAAEIATLGARVETAIGSAKQQFADADGQRAVLLEHVAAAEADAALMRQQHAAAEGAKAALAREKAAADAEVSVQWTRAEEWRKDFYASNRILIDELDRLAQRVIALAKPDPAADAGAPEVSVVMPVWNRADLVATAVRSVLAQSFGGWELVIIDDGSTDDLDGALKPFLCDPRIRFIRQANTGEARTRNRALALARGEIIAYLDSDNFWYPDFLAAAVRVFRADPALDLAYGGIAYQWPNGDVRFYLLPFGRAQLLRDNLADVNVTVHRRSTYLRLGGFDETLLRALEWDLTLRYTVDRPAAHIPVVGARYRIADGNRISANRALANNVFRVRRKWWPRPATPPRVLNVCRNFPPADESGVGDEIACMRRFGAALMVCAPEAGDAEFAPDLAVHRGPLADAIVAFRPDIVHVHGLALFAEHRATLADAGVPVTLRGRSTDATPEALARALELPNLKRAYLLPGGAAVAGVRIRTAAPVFDTTLFEPATPKDHRLVLRAAPGLPGSDLRFLLELAKLVPEHRVVIAVAGVAGHAGEIEALRAYRAEIGSPAELLVDPPRAELARLFAAAGLYVHSAAPGGTVRAGGPISIAEAMATGAYVIARNAPPFAKFVGAAGGLYRDAAEAAALVRATEVWTDAEWLAARNRAIDHAFTHHADEIVLRPLFDDWCAIARERAEAPVPG